MPTFSVGTVLFYGGIVYLARHLRLNKPVVLKGDKRTLSAKSDVLRREVDSMKNLSHTYIPQVYDFIEEDGVVYTYPSGSLRQSRIYSLQELRALAEQ